MVSDEKQLIEKAKELLKKRMAKQEVYEQLTEEFVHAASIAEVLKRIPSRYAWEKYGIWNHLLSVLMIMLFLMAVLSKPSIGIIIWFGLPMVAILTRKTRFYFWIAILAIIGAITTVATILRSSADIQTDDIIRISIFFAVLLPATFLAIWLPNKLTPEPEEVREIYENEYGERRSRVIFKFTEK